ncbi:endoribonuclease CG2145-like [Helicoverpa zea]|uniref:endoribonuclease CG2145-like n=1 Tax=Helicoverpa zea TaxID=7113 RepID=UPI001F5AF0EA|nr:endoribonuclease CG2145-like [Helicoverpa zea]
MEECVTKTLCAILLVLQITSGLEYNKQQRPNANIDFLLHEGGVQTNGNKRDYVGTQSYGSQTQTSSSQNGGSPNYASQFPALGPPPSQSQGTGVTNIHTGREGNSQSSNGKRDYVAPSFPTVKPTQQNNQNTGGNSHMQISSNSQNGGGSNFASQFPSLRPPSSPQSPSTQTQSSSGKRDYVAPQFPTLKPTQPNNQPTGGKVKDLINFYNNKNPNQGTFSYSSAVQGNKNGPTSTATLPPTRFTQPLTQSTMLTGSVYTPKPMSFSSVVAGNRPNSPTFTTSKPPTRMPGSPTTRPGTPVLPSSIVNNNNRGSGTNTNTVTDAELEALSEELLRKDTNNAAKYITVNYQAKTTSHTTEDKAPLPLITISPEVWDLPTIQKFVPLLDNYERDTLVNEYVTPQERNEENAFMDAVMSTTVMRHLMTFLKNKGYVTPDPRQQRDFLKQLWFSLYSRGKGKISSSGFEHIFVSELKNGDVLGLHNWIYFAKEEAANRANYLGYLKYSELNDKGTVMKFHFNQQGVDKPVSTIFIGTSPELEMALYTLCFVTRADNDCKLKLGTRDVNIITHTFRYRSKNLIGSAFPQI